MGSDRLDEVSFSLPRHSQLAGTSVRVKGWAGDGSSVKRNIMITEVKETVVTGFLIES